MEPRRNESSPGEQSRVREHGWPCPTSEQMRAIDADAIEREGLPGALLMENAGRAVAEAIATEFPARRRPLVACGAGNNGGDGFVVARVLRERDPDCVPLVVLLGDRERLSPESRENLDRLRACAVEVLERPDEKTLATRAAASDLIVDAVFGVGLARPVEGPLADALRTLGEARAPVVAVDVPSGICADTGRVLGVSLAPDLIVTLGWPKLGLAVQPHAAPVVCADIGLPAVSLARARVRQHVLSDAAAARLLPERPLGGHKGRFGHVLVVGGSRGKTGAVALAAMGALRCGAGLVTAAVPATLEPILEAKLTEAMTLALADSGEGHLAAPAGRHVIAECASRDVLVIGPGIGRDAPVDRAVREILEAVPQPAVVDADGLNVFGAEPEALRGPGPRVLTPHPGEASRLLGRSTAEVQADRVAAARELAGRAAAVVVLKGARTLIAAPDGELWINPNGGPGLATGGTGDVLAGMIGALLGQGLGALDAARLGVYLHGAAGDAGPASGGLAGEVAARIPALRARLLERRAQESSDERRGLRRFP